MKALFLSLTLFISLGIIGQNGIIKGRVFEKINNESIPFANVYVEELEKGRVRIRSAKQGLCPEFMEYGLIRSISITPCICIKWLIAY